MYQLQHEIGDVIKERYAVRAILGAGAFGTVYRVEEQIGARVVTLACKEMHVLSNPDTQEDERGDALRMFQEEAYLLQTLRNPHIPTAYFEMDKGIWLACPICGKTFKGTKNCPDHGNALQVIRERFYLVMDFIEGPDLEQLLEQNGEKPLSETDVLDWTTQVCEALEVVHGNGLSHRDIKPANIKLKRDTNQAMLIDFGLVKPSTSVGAFGTQRLDAKPGLGTLGYAPESPQEQANPDARTDILALGMTMYRLLTGLDPTEPAELETIRRGPPKGVNLQLSDATSAIVVRAIQPHPDSRYPDVQAMRRDLLAARYPLEVTCPHCGNVQRVPARPAADTPCSRCGRPLGDATTAQNGSASTRTPSKAGASTRAASNTPTPPPATAKKKRNTNPFEVRIKAIADELNALATAPANPNATRIAELERALADFGAARGVMSTRCPACQKADLKKVTGAQPTNLCPLCNGNLARKNYDLSACAVCRAAKLKERALDANTTFCPICRVLPLRTEKRSKLAGIVADDWQVCDHCHAQFDVLNRGKMRLDSFQEDPNGVGAQHQGQTLSLEEWRTLSTRTPKGRDCTNCGAQFDTHGDGGTGGERLWIAVHRDDPYGTAREYSERTLTREEWAKIASGGTPEDGNVECTKCRAQWDLNRAAQTLRLSGAPHQPANTPGWAEKLRGQTLPLPAWALAASGKTSGRPGYLCPNCGTEFDETSAGLTLVATNNAQLQAQGGQAMALHDWQRIAQGGLTATQASEMRRELNQLVAQAQADASTRARSSQQKRQLLEEELVQHLKQSVLQGFIPVQRMSQQAPPQNTDSAYVDVRNSAVAFALRANETLRFECPSSLCAMQLLPFLGAQWSVVADGTLAVTDERVIFSTGQSIMLQYNIANLRGANLQSVDGTPVITMGFSDTREPVSFTCRDVTWDIVFGGNSYRLRFTPQDLVRVLNG